MLYVKVKIIEGPYQGNYNLIESFYTNNFLRPIHVSVYIHDIRNLNVTLSTYMTYGCPKRNFATGRKTSREVTFWRKNAIAYSKKWQAQRCWEWFTESIVLFIIIIIYKLLANIMSTFEKNTNYTINYILLFQVVYYTVHNGGLVSSNCIECKGF